MNNKIKLKIYITILLFTIISIIFYTYKNKFENTKERETIEQIRSLIILNNSKERGEYYKNKEFKVKTIGNNYALILYKRKSGAEYGSIINLKNGTVEDITQQYQTTIKDKIIFIGNKSIAYYTKNSSTTQIIKGSEIDVDNIQYNSSYSIKISPLFSITDNSMNISPFYKNLKDEPLTKIQELNFKF